MGRNFDQRSRSRFEERHAGPDWKKGFNGKSIRVGPNQESPAPVEEKQTWATFDVASARDIDVSVTFTIGQSSMKKFGDAAKEASAAMGILGRSISEGTDKVNRTFDVHAAAAGMTRSDFIRMLFEKYDLSPANKNRVTLEDLFQDKHSTDFFKKVSAAVRENENRWFKDMFRTRQEMTDAFYNIMNFKEYEAMYGAAPGGEESMVDDKIVLPPETDTEEGKWYVVYLDDGLVPQVEEVGSVDGEPHDVWTIVDFLIGDDADPVTIAADRGDDYEVFAYRRADKKGHPYREGWVSCGGSVPEELQDNEPPRDNEQRQAYPRESAVSISLEELERERRKYGEWSEGGEAEGVQRQYAKWFRMDSRINARDVVGASQQLPSALFVKWLRQCQPAGQTWDSWVKICGECIVSNQFDGVPHSAHAEAQMAAIVRAFEQMVHNNDTRKQD